MNVYKLIEDSNSDNFNIRVNNKLNIKKDISESNDIFEIKSKNNGKTLIINFNINKDYNKKSKIVFVLNIDIVKVIGNGERQNINNLIITQERCRGTINTTKSEEIILLNNCTREVFIEKITDFLKENNIFNNYNLVEGLKYILPEFGIALDNNINNMQYMVDDYINYLEKRKKDISASNLKYVASSLICELSDEIDYLNSFYSNNNKSLKR